MIRYDFRECSIEVRSKEERKLTGVQLGMGIRTESDEDDEDDKGGCRYFTKRIVVNIEDVRKENLWGIV